MGRLFDAVASLTGLRHSIDYEAEAAIDLERAAAAAGTVGPYRGCVAEEPGGSITLDWRPIVRGVVADVVAGVPQAAIARGFHQAIADLVVDACLLLRRRGAGGAVGLTGGVFHNALLAEQATIRLGDEGFDVLLHRAVPANDGGLALGQVAIARCELSCQ
jgi:hydrogenase maturation protein HypF